MKKESLGRALAALATACAVLLAVASPASAATVDMDITGGTVVVTKATYTPLDIPLSGGSCATGTMQADISSTTTGTFTPTAFNRVTQFTYGGTTYLYTFTLGSTGSVAGSYNESTGVLTGLTVPVRLQIHTVSATDPCVAATLLCTWTSRFSLASANFSAHTSSSTATFTGTGTSLALGSPCQAPFSTYTGGSVAINNLTVHMT